MTELLFIQNILIALALGALIGLERSFTKHQLLLGLRTMSLASLTGALAAFFSIELQLPALIYISFAFLCIMAVLLYQKSNKIGVTTIAAFILSYFIGLMIFLTNIIYPIFLAIIITLILVERRPLHKFVKLLTREEIIDLLEFALIAFVVYPLLPPADLTFGIFSLNLQFIFFVVILVSLLSFAGFLFFRRLGKLGFLAINFLSGFVNANASIPTILEQFKKERLWLTGINTAIFASIFRNLLIVFFLFQALFFQILLPVLVALAYFVLILLRETSEIKSFKPKLDIKSPFSLRQAIEFGILFFVLMFFIQASQHYLASNGLIVSIFLSSLVSSAASIGTIALLVDSGKLSMANATSLTLLAIIASTIAKAGFVAFIAKKELTLKVAKYLLPAIIILLIAFLFSIGL